MAHHQDTQPDARAEQYEPILLARVIRISDQQSILVEKGRSCFFEPDAMWRPTWMSE